MSLTVFNQQVATAATEVIAQQLNVFNAASGGALIMGAGDALGDFLEATMWQAVTGLVSRRDAYSNADATVRELQQILDRAVKIDGMVGPVKVTDALMQRLGKTTEEAAAVLGLQAAKGIIQDYLNVTCKALLTAIGTQPSLVLDQSSTTTPTAPTLVGLQQAVKPFGDAANAIVAWVMTGATFNDLVTKDILVNTNRLFQIGNVTIMQDGFGRRFVVSDIDGMDDATARTSQILGLSAGSAVVQTSGLRMYDQTILGKANVSNLIQGEYHFLLSLKGYQWANKLQANPKNTGDGGTAVANKGASPSDAEIAKGSNWNKIVTDVKNTAGVILKVGGKKP